MSNPTEYITVHDPYTSASTSSETYAFGNTYETLYTYNRYVRMFVPPGTVSLYLKISQNGSNKALTRHKTPPTTTFSSISSVTEPYSLAELEASDCTTTGTLEGDLFVCTESYFSSPVDSSMCGWLYSQIAGGSEPTFYVFEFLITVDPTLYNAWWDTYVKSTSGWDKYVESVEVYSIASEPVNDGYYSLHQNEREFYYDTNSGTRASVKYYGFMDQNDPTNSIVVCGKESSDCTDAIKSTTWGLTGCYEESLIPKFKVFVPPGTSSFSLLSHVWQSETSSANRYIAVARLGRPPENPQSTSVESTEGFTLAQLKAGDCVAGNVGGYLNIAIDGACDVQTEADGGWLYVDYKVASGPTDIIDIVLSSSVNVGDVGVSGTYLDWFVNTSDPDTAGDPITSESPTVDDPDTQYFNAIPSSIEFGYIPVGYSSFPMNVTLYNKTDSALNITSSYPECFRISWEGGTIDADGSKSVSILFEPLEEIEYSGDVIFDGGSYSVTIYVSGRAISELVDTGDGINLPDVSGSSVFAEVVSLINRNLAQSDAVYAEIESNFDYIKGLVKDYGITYDILNNTGVNDTVYKEYGFSDLSINEINVTMGEVSVPEGIEPSEIENLVDFNDSIEKVSTDLVEPSNAVLNVESVEDNIYSLKPEDRVLKTIESNVEIGSVSKPTVEFVIPPIPDLPDIESLPQPDITFQYDETFYSSELGTYLYEMLLEELKNGLIGLSGDVELDLYDKQSESDLLLLQDTRDEIALTFGDTGFSMPDGYLVFALSEVETDYQNRYADKSVLIRQESLKRADDNNRFIKELSLKYEGVLIDNLSRYYNRQLAASKALLDYTVVLYNSLVKYQNLFIEQYSAQVYGYEVSVKGQAAELEAKTTVYNGDIQYSIEKANVESRNTGMNIAYQDAVIRDYDVDVSRYATEINLGSIATEGYSADINKYNVEYFGDISYLNTKIEDFNSDIQYEKAKADVELKSIENDIKIQYSYIDAKKLDNTLFLSQVSYEKAKADVSASNYEINFDQYKTKASLYDSNAKVSNTDATFQLGKISSQLEATKQQIELLKVTLNSLVSSTGSIAKVSSTMLSSALSSINARVGMNTTESQATGFYDSENKSESESTSISTSYIYKHTYED